MRIRMIVVSGVAVLVGLSVMPAQAGGLGIQLDGFLAQFNTFVVGLGLIMGLVGLAGYIGSLFDNPFSHVLAGSVGFFTKAGLLGGGTIILGQLGLVAGGLLP